MKDLSAIWTEIRSGNEKSFEDLFRNLYGPLFSFANKIIRDEQRTEEIIHDVFINLWKNRQTIIISGSINAYIYKAVHNQALNSMIQQKTRKLSSSVLMDDEAWRAMLNTCECSSYIIEKLEADDTGRMIQNAIDDLPEQCRKIFILSRIENKTNSEISEELDISINTVRTQIFRALDKIRNKIGRKD